LPSSIPQKAVKLFIALLLLGYASVSLGTGVQNGLKANNSQDLAPLYIASKIWMEGKNPYKKINDPEKARSYQSEGIPFNPKSSIVTLYSPVALLNTIFFGLFDWKTAKFIWLIFNVCLGIAAPFILWRLWYRDWPLTPAILLLLFWFSGIGLRTGLGNGQHTLLTMFCILMSLLSIRLKHPWWAGTWLVISLHKLHMGILFGPYLLLKKQYKVLIAATGIIFCALFLFLLPLAHFGKETLYAYMTSIGRLLSTNNFLVMKGVGITDIYPLLGAFLGQPFDYVIFNILVISGVGLMIWLSVREKDLTDMGIATWSLLMLWISYHRVYDTIFLFFPIAALANLIIKPRLVKAKAFRYAIWVLLFLLAVIWLLDPDKIIVLMNSMTFDLLIEKNFKQSVDFGYRLIIFLAFFIFAWLQIGLSKRSM
jgi:hypothetical protein